MNFSFETQGTHTYLIYTISQEDVIDTMSLGMITNNNIPGLAKTIFTQMDSDKFIKYDVSAHISVKQFFSGPVNKKRLLGVFKGVVNALLSAEDYMLDINTFMLDLDYIFADVSTCETVLICVPVVADDLANKDLGSFFKNIMFSTQFDQTENCGYIAKIINFLNGAPIFSLEDFAKLLNVISEEQNVKSSIPSAPKVQPSVQKIQQPEQPVVAKPQPVVQKTMPTATPQPEVVKPVAPTNFQQPAKPVEDAAKSNEKQMNWFYLMQHYNKENAALYKAQKANKNVVQPKPVASIPTPPSPAKQPPFAVPGQTPPPPPAKNNFVVPGQKPPATPGFAIPGQQPPASRGFAIPGQKVPVQETSVQKQVQQSVEQQTTTSAKPVVSQPTYTQPQMPQGQSMNFGETTVLGSGNIGETTVLGATPATQTRPHLLRAKNNEKINLDKPVFRIGKEKSYVDYFIGDNSAISRSHANVISRDGEYFIVDTNSTNHTYVDGQMIQSNVETKISHGTKIRLANEEFEFKLF